MLLAHLERPHAGYLAADVDRAIAGELLILRGDDLRAVATQHCGPRHPLYGPPLRAISFRSLEYGHVGMRVGGDGRRSASRRGHQQRARQGGSMARMAMRRRKRLGVFQRKSKPSNDRWSMSLELDSHLYSDHTL